VLQARTANAGGVKQQDMNKTEMIIINFAACKLSCTDAQTNHF